jgi:hypothetical protein
MPGKLVHFRTKARAKETMGEDGMDINRMVHEDQSLRLGFRRPLPPTWVLGSWVNVKIYVSNEFGLFFRGGLSARRFFQRYCFHAFPFLWHSHKAFFLPLPPLSCFLLRFVCMPQHQHRDPGVAPASSVISRR